MVLNADFTSDKSPGSCAGKLYANFDEVAQFHCTSEGKLLDAFYASPDDVVAFLVHLFAEPEDDNSSVNLRSIMKAHVRR
jgi:hypothetical protein